MEIPKQYTFIRQQLALDETFKFGPDQEQTKATSNALSALSASEQAARSVSSMVEGEEIFVRTAAEVHTLHLVHEAEKAEKSANALNVEKSPAQTVVSPREALKTE